MKPRRRSEPRPRRRALVMIAVMVVAGSALFIATSLTFLIQSEVASSSGAREEAQSRAVARSGLLILMNALEEQREAILNSEPFDLDDEWIVYEAPGEIGIVRLLPVGPDGGVMVREGARVDINTVSAAQLTATEMVNSTTADEIVTLRDNRKKAVQSELELLSIDSITPEMMFGPLEEIRVQTQDESAIGGDIAGEAPLRGLADLLTVYSFEPMLRRDGEPRIVFTEESYNEHENELMNWFPNARLERLTPLRETAKNAANLKDDAQFLSQLWTNGLSVEDSAIVLDYFAVGEGRYRQGRIDINNASYEALMTLTGMTPEKAAEIIRRRTSLDSDLRWTPLWLVTEQLFTADEYLRFANRVSTRCWQYRVRLMAGLMDPDQESDALRKAIIFEVVVDLSGPRPRLAYLRDVSMLEIAAAVAAGSFADEPAEDPSIFDDSQSEEGEMADSSDGGDSGAQPDDESDDDWGFGGTDLDFGDSSESDSSASDGNSDGSSGSMPESENSAPPGPERIGRWTGGG